VRWSGPDAPMQPRRVVFICTKNSARSQMAEGLLRSRVGDGFFIASAGLQKTAVHPLAVSVMQEIGIDISGQRSKPLDDLPDQPWDYAITVCDLAKEKCPTFPERTERLHWDVADPALASGTAEQRLEAFRWARDELREWIRQWLAEQDAAPNRARRPVLVLGLGLLLCGAAALGWRLGWAEGGVLAALAALVVMIPAWVWRE
jgi:arsenate reductase (thioredoxin)